MSNNYRAHVLSRHMLFWFCSSDSPMARTQRYRHIRDKSMRFTMISIFLIINNSSMKNEKFLQERNCSKSSQESAVNLYRVTSETSRVYRMRINQTFVGSVARFLSKIHQDMEKRMSYSWSSIHDVEHFPIL